MIRAKSRATKSNGRVTGRLLQRRSRPKRARVGWRGDQVQVDKVDGEGKNKWAAVGKRSNGRTRKEEDRVELTNQRGWSLQCLTGARQNGTPQVKDSRCVALSGQQWKIGCKDMHEQPSCRQQVRVEQRPWSVFLYSRHLTSLEKGSGSCKLWQLAAIPTVWR